jgi:hypothetical protein
MRCRHERVHLTLKNRNHSSCGHGMNSLRQHSKCDDFLERFVIELRVRLRRNYIFPHCRFAQTLEPCVRGSGSTGPALSFAYPLTFLARTHRSEFLVLFPCR